MASNLVLGNGVLDGITLKSIAMGAAGGAIGAGLTSALSAGADAMAGTSSLLGRGATAVKTALSEGEGVAAGAKQTLGQYGLKTGIGVANDFATNQATSLIFDHKLDLSVESLVISLGTHGVMDNAKVADLHAGAQAKIASKAPFQVKAPKVDLDGAAPSSPAEAPHPDAPAAPAEPAAPEAPAPRGEDPAPPRGPDSGHEPPPPDAAPAGGDPERRSIFVGNQEMGDIYHVAAAALLNDHVDVAFVSGDRNGSDGTTRPEDTMLRYVDPHQISTHEALSNKAMTEIRDQHENPVAATNIVADAIRSGDVAKLRGMELGLAPEQRQAVSDFLDRKLGDTAGDPLVAYWNRAGTYQPERNSTQADLDGFHQSVDGAGARVVVLGPDHLIGADGERAPLGFPQGGAGPDGPKPAIDLTNHWKDGGPSDVAMQVEMFRQLAERGLIGQAGLMSGGMDGAFLYAGTPTVEVDRPRVGAPPRPDRMGVWQDASRNPDGTPGDFQVRPTNPDGSFPDLGDQIRSWRDDAAPPHPAGEPGPGDDPRPSGGRAGFEISFEDVLTAPNPPPEIKEIQDRYRDHTNDQLERPSVKMDIQNAVRGLRLKLLANRDAEIAGAYKVMKQYGATQEQVAEMFEYLFNSRGLAFTSDNYIQWRQLSSGHPTVDNVRFLVHELHELDDLKRGGFGDPTGGDLTAARGTPEDAAWGDRFGAAYLESHSGALYHEAEFVAGEVSRLTDGEVNLTALEYAGSDPQRAQEFLDYMRIAEQKFGSHPDLRAFQRGDEPVTLSPEVAARLGLSNPQTTVKAVIAAVKQYAYPLSP
jgi:hypothetical protein